MGEIGDVYICEACGESCEKAWSDTEALEELRTNFGDVSLEDCERVCDDCYQAMIAIKPPKSFMQEMMEYDFEPSLDVDSRSTGEK